MGVLQGPTKGPMGGFMVGGVRPASGGGGPEIVDNFASTSTWTNLAGTLSVSSNEGRGGGWTTTIAQHNTGLSSVNCWVQVTVSHTVSPDDGGGLIFRSNGTRWYRVMFEGNQLRVFDTDYTFSALSTSTFATGSEYVLKIEVSNSGSDVNIKLYVNSVLEVNQTHSGGHTTGSYVGVIVDRDNNASEQYVKSFSASAL